MPVAQATNPDDILTEHDPDFYPPFDKLYALTWGDGAIPGRYKELIGVSLSVVIRCEPCLRYHIDMCIQQGGSKQEVIEAIRIGIIAGGSGGVPTARLGFNVMKELGIL